MNKTADKEQTRRLLFAGQDLHVRENSEPGAAPSRTITGYAILFNVASDPLWKDDESEAREIIDPAAITQQLLDNSDIKFTMFHDRQLILARSNRGRGTLSYQIDSKGVSFEFDAPHTADGDKALELVRRGELAGCSFMFSTRYWDEDFVERTATNVDGLTSITYRVKVITAIHDFTLAADPAYPDTSVQALERELHSAQRPAPAGAPDFMAQVREMRRAAKFPKINY